MDQIFTFGNGIFLADMFNAIAALTATADFAELIRLIFVITIPIVAIEIAFTGRFKPTTRLFVIVLMLNGGILARTNVQIIDQVEPANSSAVANVPAGLAVPVSFFSTIGNWGVTRFETFFSMPNDLRYQTNGLLFSSRLIRASQEYEITDPRMSANLSEFTQGCIYYGMLAGWFSINDVMSSGDIWAGLPAASFGNAIFVRYEDAAGNVSMDGCRNVRTRIENEWAATIDEMASVYGQRTFPQFAEATAKARLLASIPQSYQFVAGISDSAADIIRQNAMMNAIKRNFTAVAGAAGATGAIQDFAMAQAEAQQRTTYQVLGRLSGRTLVLMRNVLESIVYGIFPIAFVFTLVALLQGKAIFMYFKLLFWLQVWPPLYAIINYVAVSHAAEATTAAASQAGGGAVLNMLSQTGLSQVSADMAAMAGYMAWSVPLFAWIIVSGGGYAAANLASGIGSIAQSAGSSAAGSTSAGNISIGNSSLYNSSAFQSNSSPTMSRGLGRYVDPGTGATFTTSAGGHQTVSMPQNTTPFSASLSSSIKNSVSTGLSSSMAATKNAMSSVAESTQAAFSQMQRLSQSTGLASSASTGIESGSSSHFMTSFGSVAKVADQHAKENNMSRGQSAAMLLTASVASDRTLLGKIAEKGIGFAGSGGLNFTGDSRSAEAWRSAQQMATASDFGSKWSQAVQSAEKISASDALQSNDSQSRDLSASLASSRSASTSLQSSLTEAQAWQQLSNRLRDAGSAGNVSAVGELIRYGSAQGHDVARLAAESANIKGGSAATEATQTLNNLVSDFVSDKAANIAGVQPSYSADGISDTHASNTAAVTARAEGIELQSHDQQAALRTEGASRGVPTVADVQVAAAQAESSGDQHTASIGTHIASGGDTVNTQGASLQTEASERSAPGEQGHVVAASSQVVKAGVSGIQDMSELLVDTGKDILGMSSADESPGDNKSATNHRGTWANHLD